MYSTYILKLLRMYTYIGTKFSDWISISFTVEWTIFLLRIVKALVQIPVQRQGILTKICRVLTQCIRGSAGIIPQIRLVPLLFIPLKCITQPSSYQKFCSLSQQRQNKLHMNNSYVSHTFLQLHVLGKQIPYIFGRLVQAIIIDFHL